jgi:hypothetical protein
MCGGMSLVSAVLGIVVKNLLDQLFFKFVKTKRPPSLCIDVKQ